LDKKVYRLLDLFCGAGGAAYGYKQAGFRVIGVDIKNQPNYIGDAFIQGDALEIMMKIGHEFDFIHASPPCQFAARLGVGHRGKHKNLIPQTRETILSLDKPYIIENVEDARAWLHSPIMLCGSMFGLGVWRHRYFEFSPGYLLSPATCNHSNIPVLISGSPRRGGSRKEPSTQERRDAMQTQWMSRLEMDQAIPPAYTEWLGKKAIMYLKERAA
jgi:DNA (cytosine-5)-methyltransferase 1